MKQPNLSAVAVSTIAALATAVAAAAGSADVPYPDGYRNWTHVKSMVIEQGHPLHAPFGGLHHLYANEEAMAGYRSGDFPDGAVLVFDLLVADAADHAITEGSRKLVGVMHKDRNRYPETGGWGFEGFAGDSKTERLVKGDPVQACYGCHTSQAATGYVFSRYRD